MYPFGFVLSCGEIGTGSMRKMVLTLTRTLIPSPIPTLFPHLNRSALPWKGIIFRIIE